MRRRRVKDAGLFYLSQSPQFWGRVAERFKAAVLKTADGKLSVSSNLTPSAIIFQPK